jgi:hypothetical protein
VQPADVEGILVPSPELEGPPDVTVTVTRVPEVMAPAPEVEGVAPEMPPMETAPEMPAVLPGEPMPMEGGAPGRRLKQVRVEGNWRGPGMRERWTTGASWHGD